MEPPLQFWLLLWHLSRTSQWLRCCSLRRGQQWGISGLVCSDRRCHTYRLGKPFCTDSGPSLQLRCPIPWPHAQCPLPRPPCKGAPSFGGRVVVRTGAEDFPGFREVSTLSQSTYSSRTSRGTHWQNNGGEDFPRRADGVFCPHIILPVIVTLSAGRPPGRKDPIGCGRISLYPGRAVPVNRAVVL